MLIVGVAEDVVEPYRGVTLLLVKVLVAEIVSTVTPSTAITPPDTLDIVVSEALPSSIFPVVVTVATVMLGVPVNPVAIVLSPVLEPETEEAPAPKVRL